MTEVLPSSWALAKLGDLCEVVSGSTPRTTVPAYWNGEIAWITPDDLSGYSQKTIGNGARNITQAGYDSCSTRLVPAGTVLFTSRAPIGYVAIASQPVCTNQGFKSFVPNEALTSDYLYWFLRHEIPEIRKLGSGTTFPELSKARASEVAIPIAPLTAQRQIVAAIEEHFSRLDAADRSLAQARRRLATLRTATLDAATTGHEPVELGALVTELRYGTSIKCSYDAAGPPVLRIPNVQGGSVDLSDLKFATDADVDLSSFALEKGDLLFVRTNGSRDLIGRVASIDGAEGVAFASYLIRARPDRSRVDPRFAVIALSTPVSRALIESKAATTAGQYNLNLAALRSLPVPLPSIDEQRSIVAEVERRLTIAGAMDAEIDRALRRSTALRRSILEQAFSGKLVAQDPSDEPASALLERIAAQRAKAGQDTGRRPRRRATMKAS